MTLVPVISLPEKCVVCAFSSCLVSEVMKPFSSEFKRRNILGFVNFVSVISYSEYNNFGLGASSYLLNYLDIEIRLRTAL